VRPPKAHFYQHVSYPWYSYTPLIQSVSTPAGQSSLSKPRTFANVSLPKSNTERCSSGSRANACYRMAQSFTGSRSSSSPTARVEKPRGPLGVTITWSAATTTESERRWSLR
jgi:hypothetical protein